ncbi:MAG: ATP-binding protein [Steroidobacteraceae bacterium]
MTPGTEPVVRVPIQSANDLVDARQKGRALAGELGFSTAQATLIAAVISELARNIVEYAGRGEIVLRPDGAAGMIVSARDAGPGITDLQAALRSGYSTSGGLGLGLPGVRRIADSFEIESGPGGTVVTLAMKK